MRKEDLSQSKPLILVINADKKSCNLIEQWLTRNNFDVLRAYDGETGYQLLKTNKISLLILNSQLPDENGFDLCRRIKKKINWRELPVLLLKEKGASEADFTRSLASFSSENPIQKQELIYLANKLIAPALEDTLVEYIPGQEKSAVDEKVEKPVKKMNDIEKELNDLINAVKPTLSSSQTAYKSSEKTAETNARKITVKSDQAIKKELEDLYRLIK